MPNIPGNVIIPSVYSDVQTVSRGVSVPAGSRVLALMGLGTKSEIIVSSALGNGLDGFNSTYTSTTSGTDGRHFKLQTFPIVSNRTTLYRNGIPLTGLETSVIDSTSFSNRYDYRIIIATGQIELQAAYIINQGGSNYVASSTNVGQGVINNLSLIDANAPTETWTIRCVSVLRDSLSAPIANTAKFVAFGSVSGNQPDANGNPVLWTADNQVVSNGVLQFSIQETTPVFREGDTFTIKVKGGSLSRNDTLTATYIAEADLNDPTFYSDMDSLAADHGLVTLDNTLSLGGQLAFANAPPGVMALQTKPSLPRRRSYDLCFAFESASTEVDDYIFPLPIGVTPDTNTSINFFVTNPATNTETQILLNKFPFYTLDTTGNPTKSQFIFSSVSPPSGYSFSYTVINATAAINCAEDGYINRSLTSATTATFSSASFVFDNTYVGKELKIMDATNLANNGTWDITAVADGKLTIVAADTPPFPTFVNDTSVSFNLVNPNTGAVIPLSTGTDGTLAAIPTTADALFSSTAINFNTFANLLSLKLQITVSGTNTNEGLFDIVSYSVGPNTLTIRKSFVSESNLNFEVLDPTDESSFVVLNQNTVPNGYHVRVTVVDTRDATFFDAGWLEALEAMEKVECDILVPLPNQTMSIIFQNTLAHCRTMSNIKNRKERIMFTGAIKGLAVENLTGEEEAAVEDIGLLEGIQGDSVSEVLAGQVEDLTNYSVSDAFGSTFRCAYFYPDAIVVQVGDSNQLIDGFYLGAAAGGYFVGIPNVAMPITNKVLAGFTILRDKVLTQTQIEQLMTAGVSVLQPVQGGGRCLWGRTTTQSGFPEETEISIVFIRDRVAKSMRAGFAGFIGQPEDASTQSALSARATGLLNAFIGQGMISDYADLVVKRDTVDPTQWNISVRVQPIYPINYVFVKISVGLL